MDIAIQQVSRSDREEWQVEVFGMKVSFRDKTAALAFAIRLQERVEAPHLLPGTPDQDDVQA
ncbi:hypothetical protein FXN65_10925 [Metapseudomonas lalkuanensis]|uniref:Uncharacterized protein n=1 Tax=Metapseudomonas lalkuanensis TaxID=2604832 RepID=A0A5J6QLP6_9GAMM|nr:hypothetical protein [Pseudomonas lalkuanensis]QEY62562.1 hypothetical protein FXN65_10925 [Pseudomonas lalkuanensis]UCO96214.1 hypothetical protein LF844_16130 [Pseudomonas lalkuanensis]